MTGLIISLTSIPARFSSLGPVLASLTAQTARVDGIHLYLPRIYRRFEFSPHVIPDVPDGVRIRYVDHDYGPATKILPAAADYRGRDTAILFCDDDKIYDRNWAQRFLTAAAARPDTCIVEEGAEIAHHVPGDWTGAEQPRAVRRKKNLEYRLRRGLSLGFWKPRKTLTSGYVDLLEGWGGVLVRPDWFSDAAFRIVEPFWAVDDIWLSGHLAIRGIPIWLNAETAIRTRPGAGEIRAVALRKQVFGGMDRAALNRACINWFRSNRGIWGGAEAAMASVAAEADRLRPLAGGAA
jgi:hypothetical protein